MSKQRYVIIRGQVFRWEEKAPFVPSGKSVQGAIEYDREVDALRCHECGDWFAGLSSHVQNSHPSVTVRGYKLKHALRLSGSLITPALRNKYKEAFKCKPPQYLQKGHAIRRPRQTSAPREFTNQSGSCVAQTLLELQTIAAELGRSPLQSDVTPKLIGACDRRFGGWSKALRAAGLEPNVKLHSKDALKEALIDFYVLNRRLPKVHEFGDGRLPALSVFRNHFGSRHAAYAAAGLGLVAQECAA